MGKNWLLPDPDKFMLHSLIWNIPEAVKPSSHWWVVGLKPPHSWQVLLPAPQFLPWEPVTCSEEAFSSLRRAQIIPKSGENTFFFFLKMSLYWISSQTSPSWKGWPSSFSLRDLWAWMEFPVPCAATDTQERNIWHTLSKWSQVWNRNSCAAGTKGSFASVFKIFER